MTDITEFPAIKQVLHNRGPTWSFIAGETISAGQAVAFAATGVSRTVVAHDETAGERPFGVALFSVTVGDEVTVCLPGSIVEMANADDTTAIDAGHWVTGNDNTVKGTISVFAPRADLASTVIDGSDDTTIDETDNIIGLTLEDIAGDGTGKVLLMPYICLWTDHGVV